MVLAVRSLQRVMRTSWLMWAPLLVAIGCRTNDSGNLWGQGRQYDLMLVVTKRPAMTPERQAATAPLVDSLTAHMAVDSVRRDSVFGTYSADFLHLGIMAGRAGTTSQAFVGSARGSAVDLELSPDATDAGLRLTGKSTGNGAAGTWSVEAGRAEGRFTLRAR